MAFPPKKKKFEDPAEEAAESPAEQAEEGKSGEDKEKKFGGGKLFSAIADAHLSGKYKKKAKK